MRKSEIKWEKMRYLELARRWLKWEKWETVSSPDAKSNEQKCENLWAHHTLSTMRKFGKLWAPATTTKFKTFDLWTCIKEKLTISWKHLTNRMIVLGWLISPRLRDVVDILKPAPPLLIHTSIIPNFRFNSILLFQQKHANVFHAFVGLSTQISSTSHIPASTWMSTVSLHPGSSRFPLESLSILTGPEIGPIYRQRK